MSAPEQIRLATHDDVAAVLAMWRRAENAPSVTDDVESIAGMVDRQYLLVAELDGAVIGSLMAVYDGWRGNMYRLAVDPRFRRQGIARRLVEAGERQLHEQGCRKISAIVLRDVAHATSFWSALGYQVQTDVARYVKAPG